jgi:hypothetical protein
MGFFVGSWLHDIPDTGFDADGKQMIIKHLCFGPLETWLWYRLRDGRYCCEVHFIEGLQEGEQYTDFISKSEMLKIIEDEIALCKKYNEINLAVLLQTKKEKILLEK